MKSTLGQWAGSPDFISHYDTFVICKSSKKEGDYWIPDIPGFRFKSLDGVYIVLLKKVVELYSLFSTGESVDGNVYEKLLQETIIIPNRK